MTEIKTPIRRFIDENNEFVYVIDSSHSISDIYRWLIDENFFDEILTIHDLTEKGVLND